MDKEEEESKKEKMEEVETIGQRRMHRRERGWGVTKPFVFLTPRPTVSRQQSQTPATERAREREPSLRIFPFLWVQTLYTSITFGSASGRAAWKMPSSTHFFFFFFFSSSSFFFFYLPFQSASQITETHTYALQTQHTHTHAEKRQP